MGQPETVVSALCTELGVTRQTLYRFVSPTGELRADGLRLLDRTPRSVKPAPGFLQENPNDDVGYR